MFGPALRIGLVLIFFFSLGSGVHFHRAGLETGFFLEDCFEIPCFHSQWRVRLKMRLRKTGGPLFCCCCCFCLYAEERNRHPPRGKKNNNNNNNKNPNNFAVCITGQRFQRCSAEANMSPTEHQEEYGVSRGARKASSRRSA